MASGDKSRSDLSPYIAQYRHIRADGNDKIIAWDCARQAFWLSHSQNELESIQSILVICTEFCTELCAETAKTILFSVQNSVGYTELH